MFKVSFYVVQFGIGVLQCLQFQEYCKLKKDVKKTDEKTIDVKMTEVKMTDLKNQTWG